MLLLVIRLQDIAGTTALSFYMEKCLVYPRDNIYKQKLAANAIITNKNELFQQLFIGKEWLLKEVYHRVKNNLYTVICLLVSQARYLENDALKAIESSQHRIFAMSLIHQKLYNLKTLKPLI